jgi:hypothetical protein
MKKKTKIFVALVLLFIIGYISFKSIMNIGARDLENEKAEFVTSAVDVFNEFSTNSEIATSKYLNKALEISGTVTSIHTNVVVLDGKVSCQLQKTQKVELNKIIKIKGRVTGYDDLLEELKLDQCLIIN